MLPDVHGPNQSIFRTRQRRECCNGSPDRPVVTQLQFQRPMREIGGRRGTSNIAISVQAVVATNCQLGFDSRRLHRFPDYYQPPPRPTSLVATLLQWRSRRMTASLRTSGERCEYRIVISIVACPSSSWIAFSGTPRIVRCEANEW